MQNPPLQYHGKGGCQPEPAALERTPRSPGWSLQLTTCQPPVPGARSSQFLELKEAILKNQQENENEKIWL